MNTFLRRFECLGAARFIEYLQLHRPFPELTRPRIVALTAGRVELELLANDRIAHERGEGPFENGALCTVADLAAELVMLSSQPDGQDFEFQGMAIEYLTAARHQLRIVAQLAPEGRPAASGQKTVAVEVRKWAGAEVVCRATVAASVKAA